MTPAAQLAPLAAKLDALARPGAAEPLRIDLAAFAPGPLTEKLTALRRAIRERRRVAFTYYYEKGRCRRQIEPCLVSYRWSAWYVLGWCLDRQAFRLFKLDRLWDLEVRRETFPPRPAPPEALPPYPAAGTLRLRALFAAGEEYRLVEEYGPDAYTRTPDGRLLLERRFASWTAMRQWVLSFGGRVEVLAPAALRAELRREAAAILAQRPET